ncbi:hypothetical protein [Mycoplasma simbae]|uniref:hypothetical protein n=1 Tax=Mycoplasma simbae TaxID=36744 RepID=UPI000495C75C|nr:hypothetical protein [Mycoplasma simbae]
MEQFINIISEQSIYGAVITTLLFVGLGYLASKAGLISTQFNTKLSIFTVNYLLPILCLGAFMQNASVDNVSTIVKVLFMSLAFYVLMALYTKIAVNYFPRLISKRIHAKALAAWEKNQKSGEFEAFKEYHIKQYKARILAIELMIMYGSLQYFAYPLIKSLGHPIFDDFAIALLQIWNIPFLIAISTHMRMSFQGIKISKKDMSKVGKALAHPMLITLYISLFLYVLQFAIKTQFINPSSYHKVDATVKNIGFYTKIYDPLVHTTLNSKDVAQFWGGFRNQIPMLGTGINLAMAVVSPFAWICIGVSLQKSNLKAGIKSKSTWISVARKLVLAPLLILLLVIPLVKVGFIHSSTGVLLVLLMACPPATAALTYSLASNHSESEYIAHVSSISTLMCLITIPIWVVGSHSLLSTIAS